MDLKTIIFQPADPERHFAAIAALLSGQETEPSTQQSLLEWYHKQLDDGIHLTVALTAAGKLVGFSCIYRDNLNLEGHYGLYLIVEPDSHRQGLGSVMYDELLSQAVKWDARTLRARVRDNSEESLHFALQRGFLPKKHFIEMVFDLSSWDDARYEPIVQSLQAQGFQFTNMAELGDTREARRRLYTLNNNAAATDPGSDGIPPWASFEEFERDVCNSYWYRPEGQIVAIDTHTGVWAAMSAITVFSGADHAYNLFTGTDIRYRGRKLAQAVKSQALRTARTFEVDTVRTSHNSENVAMIAIDNKLGYKRSPGTLMIEKELEHG
jgi:mycothiol synthase